MSMTSHTCHFARPVSSFCPNGQPVFAHWYRFMQALKLHPDTTRRYIQELCKPVNGRWWDQWATNVWADMVRKGLVTKTRAFTRDSCTYLYSLTPLGLKVLDEATAKIGKAMNAWKARKEAGAKNTASQKVGTDECEYILAR